VKRTPLRRVSTRQQTTAKWMRKPIMGDSDTSLRDSVLAWADGLPWAAFGTRQICHPARDKKS
jgi:hypothetical protein